MRTSLEERKAAPTPRLRFVSRRASDCERAGVNYVSWYLLVIPAVLNLKQEGKKEIKKVSTRVEERFLTKVASYI